MVPGEDPQDWPFQEPSFGGQCVNWGGQWLRESGQSVAWPLQAPFHMFLKSEDEDLVKEWALGGGQSHDSGRF